MSGTTIMVAISWGFFIFYQIFLSPQVKQRKIIRNKLGIYELLHGLQNDLRHEILGT